jgi:hypothetical protein
MSLAAPNILDKYAGQRRRLIPRGQCLLHGFFF